MTDEEITALVSWLRNEVGDYTSPRTWEHDPRAISAADAIEQLMRERDGARCWHTKAHAFLEQLSDVRTRAETAEAALAKAREGLHHYSGMLGGYVARDTLDAIDAIMGGKSDDAA